MAVVIVTDKLEARGAVSELADEREIAHVRRGLARRIVDLGHEVGASIRNDSIDYRDPYRAARSTLPYGWVIEAFWSPDTRRGIELLGGPFDGREIQVRGALTKEPDGYPQRVLFVGGPLPMGTIYGGGPLGIPVDPFMPSERYLRHGIRTETDRWVYAAAALRAAAVSRHDKARGELVGATAGAFLRGNVYALTSTVRDRGRDQHGYWLSDDVGGLHRLGSTLKQGVSLRVTTGDSAPEPAMLLHSEETRDGFTFYVQDDSGRISAFPVRHNDFVQRYFDA